MGTERLVGSENIFGNFNANLPVIGRKLQLQPAVRAGIAQLNMEAERIIDRILQVGQAPVELEKCA